MTTPQRTKDETVFGSKKNSYLKKKKVNLINYLPMIKRMMIRKGIWNLAAIEISNKI